MDDVQKARYDRLFDAYADVDGYITRESLASHARTLADVRGQDPDSPAVAALIAESSVAWKFISGRLDIDHDGRVTRQEFYRVGEWFSDAVSRSASESEGLLDGWTRSLFGVIDANGDGAITKREYTDWLTALGFAEDTDIDAVFAGFDTNSDGTLSREEFGVCAGQFWSVFDTTVPGHRLLGP